HAAALLHDPDRRRPARVHAVRERPLAAVRELSPLPVVAADRALRVRGHPGAAAGAQERVNAAPGRAAPGGTGGAGPAPAGPPALPPRPPPGPPRVLCGPAARR